MCQICDLFALRYMYCDIEALKNAQQKVLAFSKLCFNLIFLSSTINLIYLDHQTSRKTTHVPTPNGVQECYFY